MKQVLDGLEYLQTELEKTSQRSRETRTNLDPLIERVQRLRIIAENIEEDQKAELAHARETAEQAGALIREARDFYEGKHGKRVFACGACGSSQEIGWDPADPANARTVLTLRRIRGEEVTEIPVRSETEAGSIDLQPGKDDSEIGINTYRSEAAGEEE